MLDFRLTQLGPCLGSWASLAKRSSLAEAFPQRAFANPKTHFVWDSVVDKTLGGQTVTGVRVRNVKTDETSLIETDGVFVYVGMILRTNLFAGRVELDEQGYIVTDRDQHTSVPWVFAAGDVQDRRLRQIVIVAGSGARAAIEADRFLAEIDPYAQEGGTDTMNPDLISTE